MPNIIKRLWAWLNSPCYMTEEEHKLIRQMTDEANAIAAGKWMTDSKLPEPVIPERRKSSREDKSASDFTHKELKELFSKASKNIKDSYK